MTARHTLEAEIAAQQALLDDKRNRLNALLREEVMPLRRAASRMWSTFQDDLRALEAGRTVIYTYLRRDAMRLAPLPCAPGKQHCRIPPTAPRWSVDSVQRWSQDLSARLAAGEPVVLTYYGRPRAVLCPILEAL